DFGELHADALHRFVPGDAARLPRPLRPDSCHRIEHPARMIDAVEVARDFLTQETAREGMVRIAAQLGRPAVFDRDEHAAGARAIVRADEFQRPGVAVFHEMPPRLSYGRRRFHNSPTDVTALMSSSPSPLDHALHYATIASLQTFSFPEEPH